MSMTMATALQMAWVLVCYTALVLTLPTMVFWRKLKHMRVAERFIFCVVTGNFWIISAVLLLLLMGVNSVLMLLLFTYGLGLFVIYLRHRKKVNAGLQSFGNLVLWTLRGELRAGLLLHHAVRDLGKWLRGRLRVLGCWLRPHWVELALLGVCLAGGLWLCGYQTLTYYNLGTSDLVVHTYWINNMLEGNLYISGVYPYGFHAIVYYIERLTGIPTLTMMRVFGPVQSMYIFLVFYLFLRGLCKCKFSALIGLALYLLSGAFVNNALSRFQFALPQEYAMLFLYPMGFYLSRYYQLYRRKRRGDLQYAEAAVQEGRPGIAQQQYAHAKKRNPFARLWGWMREPRPMRNSSYLLTMFMLCLLLTLAVHFYVTIAAGLLCIAITVANLPGSLKPRSFFRLMLFVGLGVMIALSPMIAAFVTGTKLEGSITWGMSIVSSYEDTSKEVNEEPYATLIESPDLTEGNYSLGQKAYLILRSAFQYLQYAVTPHQWVYMAVGSFLFTLLCCAIGLMVLKKKTYVRRWLSIVLYVFMLIMVVKYPMLGFPALMEGSRASIFLGYSLSLLFAFPFDMLYCLLSLWKRATRACNAAMCALCCALMVGLRVAPTPEGFTGWKRSLTHYYHGQYSESIELLYDLMKNYPREDWTLMSPVTESNLVYGYGWHYDIGLFILDQEDWDSSTIITVPTTYVFFLVEKRPMEYWQLVYPPKDPFRYTLVSPEEAAKTLSNAGKLTSGAVYGTYRTIIESKAYYWAEAFHKLYPYEMEVYFEDDYVICYRLTQNPNKLFNLAIDYGYNTAAPVEEATAP